MNDPTEGVLYKFLDGISNLVIINLLWILFTILGGVIFGWAPATIAMFTIYRNRAQGNKDQSNIKAMWQTYKHEFIRANLVGNVMLIAGASLLFYGFTLRQWQGVYGLLMWVIFVFTAFVYLLVLAFIFPVFIHYKIKFVEYFRYALMIGLSHLFHAIIILGIVGLFFWVSSLWIQFYILMTFSLSAFFVTYISMAVFNRIEYKQEKNEHQED